jgi:hypothetical protein
MIGKDTGVPVVREYQKISFGLLKLIVSEPILFTAHKSP